MSIVHIKKGDKVLVLAGKDRGKINKILAVNPQEHKVQVESVNIIIRHKKARSAQETGGRQEDIGFIDSSNVMVICPACNQPTRIAHKVLDGDKVRACKHCQASLDVNKLGKKDKKKGVKVDKKAKEDKSKDKSKDKADKKEVDTKSKKTDKKA